MRRGQCSLHCLFFEGNANWTVHSALYIAGLLGSIPQGKERSSEISPLALAHAVRGLYRMKICFLRCSSWECGYWRCSLAFLYHVWRFASLTWLVDALCCAWSLKSPWHLAWHRLQRVVPLTLCHGQLVQKLVMSFCEGQHFARFFQRYWSCSLVFLPKKRFSKSDPCHFPRHGCPNVCFDDFAKKIVRAPCGGFLRYLVPAMSKKYYD